MDQYKEACSFVMSFFVQHIMTLILQEFIKFMNAHNISINFAVQCLLTLHVSDTLIVGFERPN